MSRNSAEADFVEEGFDALSYRTMKAMLENAQKSSPFNQDRVLTVTRKRKGEWAVPKAV